MKVKSRIIWGIIEVKTGKITSVNLTRNWGYIAPSIRKNFKRVKLLATPSK